jgi:hypothetical protein
VEFHRNDKLERGINTTFISLIPKVKNPQKLNDFHPIRWWVVCIKFWPKS